MVASSVWTTVPPRLLEHLHLFCVPSLAMTVVISTAGKPARICRLPTVRFATCGTRIVKLWIHFVHLRAGFPAAIASGGRDVVPIAKHGVRTPLVCVWSLGYALAPLHRHPGSGGYAT